MTEDSSASNGKAGDSDEKAASHALVEKIRPYVEVEGWKALKPKAKIIFDAAVELTKSMALEDSALAEELSYEKTEYFFERVGVEHFDRSLADLLHEDIFERFDFDGDGRLSFVEAYKCLKQTLKNKYQEEVQSKKEVELSSLEDHGIRKETLLGEGAQGAAWLATSNEFGKIALKVYDKSNPNASSIDDIIDELRFLQTLKKNDYVMHALEVFQDDKCLYTVNELLSGGDLTQLREHAHHAGLSLSENYFKPIFKQCLLGLKYIHEHAIIHCDIKEPNIMIKNTDFMKPHIAIIDFGLATAAAGDGGSGGTPGYRPPETNETNIWYPRGDNFSMGVTFFQLLANKVPDGRRKMGIFQEGATSVEDCLRITAERELPLYKIGAFPGVLSWLPKMLEKKRTDRPKCLHTLEDEWFAPAGEEVVFYPQVPKPKRACSGWCEVLFP